jgi:hypothetical protein
MFGKSVSGAQRALSFVVQTFQQLAVCARESQSRQFPLREPPGVPAARHVRSIQDPHPKCIENDPVTRDRVADGCKRNQLMGIEMESVCTRGAPIGGSSLQLDVWKLPQPCIDDSCGPTTDKPSAIVFDDQRDEPA